MRSISKYIFESKEVSTKSNKQRKEELEKWLKYKKYDDFIDTLNIMLEDPKAKTLLEDGFGGKLGDTKLDFSVKNITASSLIPTQNNIDLDKSIKYALSDKDKFLATFDEPINIIKPIITFRKNYIIDGHHTWLQAITLNPNGKILAFNYDGDISPVQMLKTVQGTIAAVKAENGETELPSNKVKGQNIFDDNFNEKQIKEYIEKNLNEDIIDLYVDNIKECYDYKTTVKYLVNRILDIKANNYPFDWAPSREDMPQVWKAGKDKNDKKSALPDKKGSAMNKLKDDKFMKSAIK